MRERHPPEDPREWLNRAYSNLAIAETLGTDIYFEDLCFNAQQAAEKAIKAVIIDRGASFPYVHDLASLLTIIESTGQSVPAEIYNAESLTRFAVVTRYPGVGPPISETDYGSAVALARVVVEWAEQQVGNR